MRKLSPKKLKKLIITCTICVAVIFGVAGYAWYESQRQPLLEIYVLPLKSGQSIFIRTPEDKRILIDGGASAEIIRKVSNILPFYTRRIDLVIATKADGKHVSGLIDVLDRYNVGEVAVPTMDLFGLDLASSTDQIYEIFLSATKAHQIPLKKVSAGDSMVMGDVHLDMLFPTASSLFKYSKASGPELVLRISYASSSVLSAGAITPKIQKFIVASQATSRTIKSDVLIFSQNFIASKVAPIFMNEVVPDYVIYSKAIKKTAQEAIVEERRFNIREGNGVKVVSDGGELKIEKL